MTHRRFATHEEDGDDSKLADVSMHLNTLGHMLTSMIELLCSSISCADLRADWASERLACLCFKSSKS